MTSTEVRSQLVDELRLDLIGPSSGHELESEILPSPPSRWYLTDFLVPHEAAEDARRDETSDEQLELAAVSESGDDDAAAEQATRSGRSTQTSSATGSSACRSRCCSASEWGWESSAYGGDSARD